MVSIMETVSSRGMIELSIRPSDRLGGCSTFWPTAIVRNSRLTELEDLLHGLHDGNRLVKGHDRTFDTPIGDATSSFYRLVAKSPALVLKLKTLWLAHSRHERERRRFVETALDLDASVFSNDARPYWSSRHRRTRQY